MYEKFRIELQFRSKILGGIPKNLELIEPWLRGRGVPAPVAKDMAPDIAEEVDVTGEAEKAWTGFKRDDDGLYIEDRQVKASLKETANILKITSKVRGSRNYIQHGVFVKPQRIHFTRDDKLVKEPDGFVEKAIHVMTAQGPRDALKRSDYVLKATVVFEIWMVKPYHEDGRTMLAKSHLEAMFKLGEENGLGASRTQGYGKYNLVKLEAIQ